VKKAVQLSAGLPSVCRLGLATRGNTHLETSAVEYAIERGVNYLNWCGKPDGMSRVIAGLGARRKDVVAAVQFQARGAEKAKREFDWLLDQLSTDYIDIATLYYVEAEDEWRQIVAPGGAWEALAERKQAGTLRMIGLTSHQRKLAAAWGALRAPGHEAGRYLDMLMIRYNAAHRGAEEDVFPLTAKLGTPVVTFTGLRWRALPRSTPDDPAGFSPPSAAQFYRFCLSNPAVSVALTAPDNRAELEENLTLLDDWRALTAQEDEALRNHGDRVRKHAGEFW
jgi:predicted aldo/keto reductase-like oxidoreductase